MAGGHENLRVPTSEEARENGRKGGLASAESKRYKKNLQNLANALLEADHLDPEMNATLEAMGLEKSNGAAMLTALFQKAMSGKKGSEQAARFLRDTSGQAPKVVAQIVTTEGMTADDLRNMSDEELRAMLDQADEAEDES